MSDNLLPPQGHSSWLDYAIQSMDTRSLHLQSIESGPWGRIVQRGEMRDAAEAELTNMRIEIERLREQLGWWQDATGTSAANAKHWAADKDKEIKRLQENNLLLQKAQETAVVGWDDDKSQFEAEIERLGRCNEQLSHSHAEVINTQNADITRLRAELLAEQQSHNRTSKQAGEWRRENLQEIEQLKEALQAAQQSLLREGMERDQARAAARELAEYRPVPKPDRDRWIARFPWLEDDDE